MRRLVLALALFAGLTAISMTILSTGLGVVTTGRWARQAFERMAPAIGVGSLLFGCWYVMGALELAATLTGAPSLQAPRDLDAAGATG